MKKIKFIGLIFGLLVCFTSVRAQDENPPVNNPNPQQQNRWRDLELSPEQLKQIRQINQINRPLLNQAQRRQREALRLLDEAVYAENIDENLIAERLKNLQNAHSELHKIRTDTELSFRKILTSEQLVKFQELRQQIKRRKEIFNRQGDRRLKPERPLRLQPKRLPNRQ